VVTNFYSDSAALLLSNGMVISMGLSGALLYASNWIGLKFDSYMESGYVVGNEEEESNLGKKEKKRKEKKKREEKGHGQNGSRNRKRKRERNVRANCLFENEI
jgi:hypothetical protein